MARPRKESVALNINLDTEANEKLLKFCDITGLTKTKAIEKAIIQYIDEYFKSHPDELISKK